MRVLLQPVFDKRPEFLPIFKQIAEPERVIQFRVTWMDDKHNLHVGAVSPLLWGPALGTWDALIMY